MHHACLGSSRRPRRFLRALFYVSRGTLVAVRRLRTARLAGLLGLYPLQLNCCAVSGVAGGC
eukprot:11612441-Alexandrium_andersonii.AAC.1